MTEQEFMISFQALTPEQQEQLTKQMIELLQLNESLTNTRPGICPCCGSAEGHFIRKGYAGLNRKQRYLCKDCGKKFTYDTDKLTACSQQSKEKWAEFIRQTISLTPLEETALSLGISKPTAFRMRHKFLLCLEKAISDGRLLTEMIEADETYVLESTKGTKPIDRVSRHRGGKASKRGLSNEQMCVCVATDRNQNVVAKCVNRGAPTADEVIDAIGESIGEHSVFQCDGSNAYNKLIDEKSCEKVELKNHADYNNGHHLNTVNGIHSRFKAMLRQFRGIASKYLNRYLALLVTLERLIKQQTTERVNTIRGMLSSIEFGVRIEDLAKCSLLCI